MSRKVFNIMKEFTPDRYLGHKIGRISRNIDRYFDKKRCANDTCIPRSQGMIIGYIMENPGVDIFQRDIEMKFDLSGATVTNLLKNLEKNGFIVRTPMENDARLKKIELTQKALDHEMRVRNNIRTIESAMKSGFSDAEFEVLLGYMNRVIENLENLNREK